MKKKSKNEKLIIDVPKKPLVRIKRWDTRTWLVDFRGISSHPPVTDFDKNKLRGLRNYAGEKPIFSSPEALEKDIEMYFESCYEPLIDKKKGTVVRDENGEIIRVQTKPFTISGLSRYIGVPSTSLERLASGVLDDWAEEDDDKLYSSILKRAKHRIEEYSEIRLFDRDGYNGARFVLDTHFYRLMTKERREIQERERLLALKEQEFELKKQAMQFGTDEDNSLKVTIVSKED